MMRKLMLTLLLACNSLVLAGPTNADTVGDPVVLTVTGHISKANRGPLDPFEDAVLSHLDIKFDKAFTFTLADLKALPQQTVTVKYPDWPREVTSTGPALADVLKAAGADGAKIDVQAIDGYAPEFTADDVARGTMILALQADGKPLAIGGRGPLWLVGPQDSFAGQQADEFFAFAVVHIDVQ